MKLQAKLAEIERKLSEIIENEAMTSDEKTLLKKSRARVRLVQKNILMIRTEGRTITHLYKL